MDKPDMQANEQLSRAVFSGKALRPTLLALAVAQSLAAPIMAATIEVNDPADSNPSGACSLRQAVVSANSNAVASGSNCVAGDIGNDTITFSSSVLSGGSISVTQAATINITQDLEINGPLDSSLVIDGMNNEGVFLTNSATVSLNNLTITGGSTTKGGALYTLHTTVNLNEVIISGNSTTLFGGGVAVYASTININQSTISNNSTSNFFGGGGLFVLENSNAYLNNSTVSGNYAYFGGGLDVKQGANLTLSNSTVSDNTARYFGGGIFAADSSVTLINNVISGNHSPTGSEIHNSGYAATFTSSDNVLGENSTENFNALRGFTASGSDITATSNGTQPTALATIIGPLADNGGVTPTHALGISSPALNNGDFAVCQAAPINGVDQRGLPRTGGEKCDVGAYELQFDGIVVDTLQDTTGSISLCSLRDAISSSNTDTVVGNCIEGDGDDQIIFDPSVFPPNSKSTITLSSSLPAITSNMTINGPDAAKLTIDANNVGRVLEISNAVVGLGYLTIAGGSAASGGGILATSSDLSINNSTVTGNSSVAEGGGIVATTNSNLNISNSTISGNSAGSSGGGLVSKDNSSLTLTNSTIANNSASTSGGGISLSTNNVVSIRNSIISGNRASAAAEIEDFDNTSSYSTTNNLVGDSANSSAQAFSSFNFTASDITATNDGTQPTPLASIFAPLANNGGATQTHKLVPDSPAIDAGDDTVCATVPISNLDQRGRKRPIGTSCDMGSFEAEISGQFFVVPLANGKVITFSL